VAGLGGFFLEAKSPAVPSLHPHWSFVAWSGLLWQNPERFRSFSIAPCPEQSEHVRARKLFSLPPSRSTLRQPVGRFGHIWARYARSLIGGCLRDPLRWQALAGFGRLWQGFWRLSRSGDPRLGVRLGGMTVISSQSCAGKTSFVAGATASQLHSGTAVSATLAFVYLHDRIPEARADYSAINSTTRNAPPFALVFFLLPFAFLLGSLTCRAILSVERSPCQGLRVDFCVLMIQARQNRL
jgi:hypothetical protein